MLVLSRKQGESIYIGNDIRITVVSIEGGKIRIGIEAPRQMPIIREELLPKEETTQQIDSESGFELEVHA